MNIYEIITEKMIDSLKRGEVPWHRPWLMTSQAAWNRVTGREYSLLNRLLLHREGEYATFKQWKECGGEVRKGEKSSMVTFWTQFELKDREPIGFKDDGSLEYPTVPVLRYYNVFHISQVDGVEVKRTSKLNGVNTRPEVEKHMDADKILSEYFQREKIATHLDAFSNRAFYRPSDDSITLPSRQQFINMAEYYSTLFHESVHSTGHETRLKRLKPAIEQILGDERKDYAKEELVAEMGAAFLMATVGIDSEGAFDNSTGYIQSWLKALENDPKMVVFAASQAEKAVKFIKGEIASSKVSEENLEAAGE